MEFLFVLPIQQGFQIIPAAPPGPSSSGKIPCWAIFFPSWKNPLIPLPAVDLMGLEGTILYFSNLFSNIANLHGKNENEPNKWERRDREIWLDVLPMDLIRADKKNPKFVISDQMRVLLMGHLE